MKIVYMGTPDFAVPCLQALFEKGYEIPLVVTQPDKPQGRKQILTPPPVKELAMRLGISVYQPDTLKTDEAYEKLSACEPDFIVVAAYGKILPQRILDIPKKACINVHGSLLPKYRGAAPIQWAVINGENEAGVTTMLMAAGLDTGDMLLTYKTAVGEKETAGELFDRLAEASPDLLLETLENFDEIIPIKQNDEDASYAAMLTKELAVINPEKSQAEIFNLVRGLNPWPVANILVGNDKMKVYSAEKVDKMTNKTPGEIFDDDGNIALVCGDGKIIYLTEVQATGGKKMSGKDFLRGHRL